MRCALYATGSLPFSKVQSAEGLGAPHWQSCPQVHSSAARGGGRGGAAGGETTTGHVSTEDAGAPVQGPGLFPRRSPRASARVTTRGGNANAGCIIIHAEASRSITLTGAWAKAWCLTSITRGGSVVLVYSVPRKILEFRE